jgi:hypothetical protein
LQTHASYRILTRSYLAAGILLITALASCSRRTGTMNVIVPSGFTGHVQISCNGTSDANTVVNLRPDGFSDNVPCPAKVSKVTIIRDNQKIQPLHGIQTLTTGDNIVVGLAFDIQ